MGTPRLLPSSEYHRWEAWVRAHPEGSLWQSDAWGCFQRGLGRSVSIYVVEEHDAIIAGCQVVIDRTLGGFATWDAPRGPLWKPGAAHAARMLLEHIAVAASRERGLAVYASPPVALEPPASQAHISPRHEQPQATRFLDLSNDDDTLLRQMKPKGRYNIRVAQRSGVQVLPSSDVSAFHSILQETAQRDAFGVLPLAHYRAFLDTLPGAFLLLAYEKDATAAMRPLAGLLGVTWNGQGIYYYGASDYSRRSLMAPYALQWAALQHCRAAGCTRYDLLGVAPPDASPKHPWSGVTRFKEQFGGTLVVYPPEQEILLRPLLSALLRLKRRML